MEEVLLELLHRLEVVRGGHEELGYTDVKEEMYDAVFHGFIKPKLKYTLPEEFSFDTPEGSHELRGVLAWFLRAAGQAAERDGLDTFHKRLLAFQTFHERLLSLQNSGTRTARDDDYYDFFGWFDPEQFDEAGFRWGWSTELPRGWSQKL